MLGVTTAPDVNSKEQETVLRLKYEQWSKSLQEKSLYQHEALLSYHHALMPSLQYPLGPSLLQEKQYYHIQSPALTTILQKCGIVSTIARDIVHGPSRYCALNFTNAYDDAGCQKIKLLLGHIRKGDKTVEILNVALGCKQQEIGISTFFLLEPHSDYSAICTRSWLQILWEFLEVVGGTIDHPTVFLPLRPLKNVINLSEFI